METKSPRTAIAVALLALSALPLALLAQRSPQPRVDFEREVLPLLKKRCYACHGDGARLGNFQLDSRAALLQGGTTHPVVRPGKGAESYLIKLVSGKVPGKIMPVRGPRLTSAEVGLLTRWIDQGASYGARGLAEPWRPPLEPRQPPVPPAPAGAAHLGPVDRFVRVTLAAQGLQFGPPVDDRRFARRVYLDILGILPPPEALEAFAADRAPDKRARLVDRLLADDHAYAAHWLTFWNDLLRNDYAGTGYIDGGRTQITRWLYRALAENMPYNQFVRELVNPHPESAGFVKGIVWRGVVNASQTPEMQAAQSVSQVFMGVNLKCASCHDSFIDNWKLADAYGLAGVYAEGKLEMVRCDQPLGKSAPIKFLYPSLGSIPAGAPREQRMAALADLMTHPRNGRLSRTLVNRIWARLMGRGLIEPTDQMDARPWNPDLLDWLAWEFSQNGYNVRRLIRTICLSRAYQMPAVPQHGEQVTAYQFRGPMVKRISAEQFVDGVSALTGVWNRPAFHPLAQNPAESQRFGARILWSSGLMRAGYAEVDLDVAGAEALALIVTDGGNGADYDWANWVNPVVETKNGEVKLAEAEWIVGTTGYGTIQRNKSIVSKPLRLGEREYGAGIGTHANSLILFRLPPDAQRFRALAGPDTGAVEQKDSRTSLVMRVIAGGRGLVETRAALALADPLTTALGRPNREQVVSQRSPVATTLQALELTNGGTLTSLLHAGAERWMGLGSAEETARRMWRTVLGREPTAAEIRLASEMLGSPIRREGVEDLLWSLLMLPEFQLIY